MDQQEPTSSPYHGKTPVSSDQLGSFVVPRNKVVEPVDNRPKPIPSAPEQINVPIQAPAQMQQPMQVPVQTTNPGQFVAQQPVQAVPAQEQVTPMQSVASQIASAQQEMPQMSAAQVAEMQAQLLARAILEAQRIGRTGHLPLQTYQRSEPMAPVDDDEPTVKDMRDERPPQVIATNTRGERVIQPIHDVVREQQRDDMSRRITELLGGENEITPVTISTTTLKQARRNARRQEQTEQPQLTPQQYAEMQQQMLMQQQAQQSVTSAQLAAQQMFPTLGLSGQVIEPTRANQATALPGMMPVLPQPMQPQIYTLQTQVNSGNQSARQQEYVEGQYQNTPATSYGITSQMQDAQIQSQMPSDVQSMDPRLAIMQQQQLMAANNQQNTPQGAIDPAQYLQMMQQQAAVQGAVPTQQMPVQQLTPEQYAEMQQAIMAQEAMAPPEEPHVRSKASRLGGKRFNLRVNDEVVKKAALASILESQKKKQPEPEPEPEPEPIEAIRPAYIEELEEELAGDMKKKDESKMGSRMAEELADDESTINAASIKVEEPDEPAAEEVADATPQSILDAIEKANPGVSANPNMSESPNISNA